jgi:hypothetical protein
VPITIRSVDRLVKPTASQGFNLLHQFPGSSIDLLGRTRKEIETKKEQESAAPTGGTRLASEGRKLPNSHSNARLDRFIDPRRALDGDQHEQNNMLGLGRTS